MKHNHGFLIGIAALITAAIFTLAGCDPGDGGGKNDDTKPNTQTPAPTVTGVTVVTVRPDDIVAKGYSLQFNATVAGTNNPAQTVTWSITNNDIAPGTAIDDTGKLTVAAAETRSRIDVKATSTANTTKSGTKSVTVVWHDVVVWYDATDLNSVGFASSGQFDTILGMAFGNNGQCVAVGTRGKIAYTGSGGWQAADTSNSGFSSALICSVTFGSDRFVAVGAGGKIAYSTDDGATWQAANTSNSGFSSALICSVTFGSDRFVAVGAGGKIAYSTDDGATWQAADTSSSGFGADDTIYDVAFGNNRFVAVGGNGDEGHYGRIAYSTNDGATWQAANTSGAGFISSISGVAYGNNRFVASGGYIAYSTDGGETWRAADAIRGFDKVAYGNDLFIGAFSSDGGVTSVYSRDNGETWHLAYTGSLPSGKSAFSNVAYNNHPFPEFVVGGRNGQLISAFPYPYSWE